MPGTKEPKISYSVIRIVTCIMLLALVCVFTAGCGIGGQNSKDRAGTGDAAEESGNAGNAGTEDAGTGGKEGFDVSDNSDYVVLEDVPEYSGMPYVEINGNRPEFTKKEIRRAKKTAVRKGKRFEVLSELDRYGRCGSAVAAVSRDTMPDEERGSIGMVRPSGWQLDKYDFIDNGGYLYNRCHMIGWQLTGLNDEERNLMTGTRYMNTEGMLPFENRVAEYVMKTGEHVLYRATPIFKGSELLVRGIELEAMSLEDDGKGLSFNVYCYNVQPGVKINYKTGESRLDEKTDPDTAKDEADGQANGTAGAGGQTGEGGQAGGNSQTKAGAQVGDGGQTGEGATAGEGGQAREGGEPQSYPELEVPKDVTYVLNTNTMRFHRTDCKGARSIRKHNLEWFYGTRKEAIRAGYVPCGMCNP